MLPNDPTQAARELEKLAGDLEQRGRRFIDLHQKMNALSVTETSADGSVRVTVDGNGVPTELTITERGRGTDPARLSSELMSCMQRAQVKLRARVEETTRETVGEDEAATPILNQYAARFPDEQQAGAAPLRQHRLGDIEDD
ncbi:YbaB/EbfC family nucleoid-associated protein [Actinokineospora xionganensis]|uniref:YbaB/EbfC family nucleoid-associated protein n=1 Tax=Actinokineospora xionganensis TaxID=2684470 RepID=A0ABR7L8Y4_9PSEU|nr:YbaB/EbfC family nucleoid-associated protein [Actinokineospora xionganensis]MBC6449109.1 YbaB/EbfC family nucleoid-associated protein [Actinokineospora xionganensis]